MSPAAQDDLVRVARIGKPHGIRGEVTVQVFTDDPDARFAPGERLVVRDGAPGLPAELTVTRARWNKQILVVGFAESLDRNVAETLPGYERVWGAALTLILIVMGLNLLARWIARAGRLKER